MGDPESGVWRGRILVDPCGRIVVCWPPAIRRAGGGVPGRPEMMDGNRASFTRQPATAMRQTAIAIFAHPDDVEFFAAGTLVLLKQAGFEIHYFNLSSGNCGSVRMDGDETGRVRLGEAKQAASILGANFHPPVCDDLEILYSVPLLRRVAGVIRRVKPSIVLTHPPQDYMEDHVNTCRLAVSAAFTHGAPNFRTEPPSRDAYADDVFVYHSMPHGLCDPLRVPVVAGSFVDTTGVHQEKRRALAAHASQKDWLDRSQGIGSYLEALDELALRVGRLSGRFEMAEGWSRHLHYGFSARNEDPLAGILGDGYLVNPDHPSESFRFSSGIPE
jgi:LmbE family N-acetylglucosaminyl deacetylase